MGFNRKTEAPIKLLAQRLPGIEPEPYIIHALFKVQDTIKHAQAHRPEVFHERRKGFDFTRGILKGLRDFCRGIKARNGHITAPQKRLRALLQPMRIGRMRGDIDLATDSAEFNLPYSMPTCEVSNFWQSQLFTAHA